MSRRVIIAILFCVGIVGAFPIGMTQAQTVTPLVLTGPEDVYDPFQLLTLNLSMDPAVWTEIREDTDYEFEPEVQFWADGEEPIAVSVRRKSADALPDETNPEKVSLKIDINEYVSGQEWHGLKKLSLENGDDHQNVIYEGFAWYMHRLAAGSEGYGYMPGRAAWVNLYVNGEFIGVYINVEQPDKSFLNNRGLWPDPDNGDDPWLIKYSDIDSPEVKVGAEDASGNPVGNTTFDTLCYPPFQDECSAPTTGNFTAEVSLLVDMQGMLTLGAVDAIQVGPDQLFSKGKNFYHIDHSPGNKRMYIPWDLDSNFNGANKADQSIYDLGKQNGTTAYENLIIDNETFRSLYNQIICDLIEVGGPFDETGLIEDLDEFELLLTEALEADPNNFEAIEAFDTLRTWVSARMEHVAGQLSSSCDDALAVSLSSFKATRDGSAVNFDWVTATETGNAGFNIYVEMAEGLVQINDGLIPSSVIDSVIPTSYRYTTSVIGTHYYIKMVSIDGHTQTFGPFIVSEPTSQPDEAQMEANIWLPMVMQ